jgi:AcrR family transcriptional regulator
MARQAERREATRGAILAAAQRLFGDQGFAATSVDTIASDAGVAKGAVYHHFATKEAIFEAVLEAVSADLAAEVMAATREAPDVLATLGAASRGYFAATARPATRRIVLEDGPVVLGWLRWREIDLKHFEGAVPRVLSAAMEQGLIARQPIEPLSRVLQGAMTEAAMAAASGGDGAAYLDALASVVDGLRRR